jgi:protein O-GlcNAc transferase
MPHSFNNTLIDIDAELQKAIRMHQDGQLQKAEEIYKKILASVPDHSDAYHLFGFLSLQQGDYVLAASLIKKAINIDPSSPLYYNSLGLVFSALGQHDEAIDSYHAALAIHPDYAETHHNLGDALLEQGRYEEAAVSYKHALKILPQDAELHHHLGRIMEDLGNFDEALDCYRKALEIQPHNSEAYNDMGLVLRQQGKFAEALSSLQKAVEIKTDCVEAHNNLGNLLQDVGRLEAASECYRQALAIQPDFAKGYSNLGMACQGMGKSEEAVACFRKAIEIWPDYASAFRHLVHQLQKDCSWSEMEAPAAGLDRLTKVSLDAGVRPAEDPFLNLTRHPNPAHNLAVARAWSTDICRRVADVKPGFSFDDRRFRSKPITIGYLSNNFHDHPMAHLLLGLFHLHDRNQFKIHCYSCDQEDDSLYRQRILRDCDKFVDLHDISHLEAARAIYHDRVDILVDLMGHTRGSRMEIGALRPAPIQVRYLGLAGTTGADFFDYLLTDKIVTPEFHALHYTENFVYLPHCYQINDYKQMPGNDDSLAEEPDLLTDGFVFCSFNQDYKIETVMFDCWMQILRRVPNSVLWLMARYDATVENLRIEAQKRGVDPDRLVFMERRSKPGHLARLSKADLALDTRIVNGAATTSDALWAGVPVITLIGSHFASRMSASILTAIGLPELIAHSIEEYEAIAVQTALDGDRLAGLRQKLARNRLTEPLFDTPRLARYLEQAYSEMWQIFQAGSKPRQLEVMASLPACKPIRAQTEK